MVLDWLWTFVGSNLIQVANIASSSKLQPKQQHQYRMREGDAAMHRQILEQHVANELHMDFQVFQQQLANKAAEAAARRQVETAEEIDLNRRFAENNPFFDAIGYVQRSLFKNYADEQKPILLISPFWDETQTNVAADAGGLNQFRTALGRAWRRSPWSTDFILLDGFFKRPLRQTDRDIRIIHETLRDLPVILVHGFLDGHAAYPNLATWNVMPGEGDRLVRIEGEGALPGKAEKSTAPQFRDEIGDRVATMCGVMGAAYYRVRDGRPIKRELFREAEPRLLQWFDVVDQVADAEAGGTEPQITEQ